MPDTMIFGKYAVFYHQMSLLAKFELLDSSADLSGVCDQAIPARERASGKPVLVHILANGPDRPPERLLAAVAKLPPEQLCRILEVGESAGVRYVVTDPIPGVPHLRQWIETVTGSPGISGSSGFIPKLATTANSAQEPPRHVEPGEFTRLFAVPRQAPANQPALGAPAEPTGNPEPGEFTRLFQPAPLAPGSQLPPAVPGEFTRLFQQPAGEPVSPIFSRETPLVQPQPQAAPEKPEIGEFTRMFAVPPAPPIPPSVPPPAPAPALPLNSGGDAEPPRAGEFTRMFSASLAAPEPQSPLPQPTLQPPAATHPSQVSGMFEYTAAAAITPAAVSGAVPATPAKAGQRPTQPKPMSYLPIIVILTALFGLAVVVVIFFATRR